MSEYPDDRLVQAVLLGKQLVTQNQDLIESNAQLSSQIEKLKSEINSLETQFEIASMKNVDLQSVNSSNEDEIKLLTQSLQQSRIDLDKLTREHESLKLKHRQNQYLEKRINELTIKLEDRAQRINELEILLIKRNDQLLDLTEVHEQTLERVNLLTQIDSDYQELRKQVSELIVTNKELEFLIEKYKRENQQSHDLNTKLSIQNDMYRNDNARLIVEVESFDKQKCSQLQLDKDELTKSLNDKNHILTETQIRLDNLKEKYQNDSDRWYEKHDELESSLKYYNDLHIQDQQSIDKLSSEIERLLKLLDIHKLEFETTSLDMKTQLNKDSQLIDEYSLELSRCKDQLKIKQNELESLIDKLNHMNELKEILILKIKKDHESYINQLITEHQMNITKMKQIHEHELNIMKNENSILSRDIEQLYQQHKITIDTIKLESTETSQNYEQQLQMLRQQLAHKDLIITETKKELEIYKSEMAERKLLHNKLYNDLYSDLNKQIGDLQVEVKMWKDKLNTEETTDDKDQKIKRLTIDLSRLQTERDLLVSKQSQNYSTSEDSISESISTNSQTYNVTQIIDRSKVVKEGFIYRRGTRNKWRRVYAFIEDNVLFYTKDQSQKYKSKGVKLTHAKMEMRNVEMLEDVRKYYVRITDVDEKQHHFSFESKEDMSSWYKLIRIISGTVDPTK